MKPEIYQRIQDYRGRLVRVFRTLAGQQRHPKYQQVFRDMTCNLSGELPVTPDGFVVRHPTWIRHGNVPSRVLCLYQVAAMAVTYLKLYTGTEDQQDARSCKHYLGWLEDYAKAPDGYDVIHDGHLGLYLYLNDGSEPHVPAWLGDETV